MSYNSNGSFISFASTPSIWGQEEDSWEEVEKSIDYNPTELTCKIRCGPELLEKLYFMECYPNVRLQESSMLLILTEVYTKDTIPLTLEFLARSQLGKEKYNEYNYFFQFGKLIMSIEQILKEV